jgi:hypothetical protein
MSIVRGKRTSIESVRQYIAAMDGLLLSHTYSNMLEKLDWQCKEGHVFSTTFNHIKNRGQWCPVCGREKGLANMRKTFTNDPSIRQKISASHQKIAIEQFQGFVSKSNGKKVKAINHKRRYKTDPIYKMKLSLRNRLNMFLKSNNLEKHNISAVKDLGCSIEELKTHLESKFQPGMSWDNYGTKGWHIDHIKPLALFNLADSNELKKACHYTNLQPLWWQDNLHKGAKYVEE